MSTKATVPVFSPDGQLGDIPQENLVSALKAGFKQGVTMKTGDGKLGVVPADRVPDAAKAGLQIVPLGDQDAQHAGFWHSLYSDLAGMVSNINPPLTELGTLNPEMVKGVAQGMGNDAERKAAGYSKTYRALAPIAGSVANVTGMEDAAKQGDIGGVAGHAAAPAVALGTAEAVSRLTPRIAGSASNLATDTAQRMYQSALKPSTRLSPGKVASAVDAGLSQNIPVSEAGAEKLTNLISDLNQRIANEIAAKKGVTIDPNKVAQRLNDTRTNFANQVNPESDLAAIDSSKAEFLRNQGAKAGKPPVAPLPTGILDANGNPVMTSGRPATPATPAQPMSAVDAQALKQGTYAQLKDKSYGEMQTATKEAQKALARGIKEELNQQFPELAGLNARDSQFYGLDQILEKAVQRQANRQLIGLGTPAAAAAGGALTGTGVGAIAAGALKAVIDDPVFKSRLAIALSKGGKVMSWSEANARVAAYSSALAAAAQPRGDQTSESH